MDDDENIRLVTSAMVEDMGLKAMSAWNGLEALDLYRRYQDEITGVLMDMSMPEMDGRECCRELLNMNPAVKIIFASGYNEQDTVARFGGRGLAGFIQKPYSPGALKAVLKKAL
ncbi:MAG: response regulator [Mariprofundus sp.]|nr:response regulator [Mariprofundus sp.]